MADETGRDKPGLAGFAGAGFFALLPAAATAGGLALAPFLGLAGALAARPSALRRAFADAPVFVGALLAFLAWAIGSTAWTIFSDHGQALRLAATALPGLVFVAGIGADSGTRRLAGAAGIAAALVLIALLATEALGDLALNRLAQPDADTERLLRNPGRGVTVLVVLVWGALAAALSLRGGWRYALAALLLIPAALLSPQFDMNANAVGFAFGLLAFIAGAIAPRLAAGALLGGLALWLLAAPFVTPLVLDVAGVPERLPLSWAIRTEIWRFACGEIMQHPLLGVGLDGARAYDDMIQVRGETLSALPLHPHSASLQIWLETGAIGALLGATVLLAGAFTLMRALKGKRLAGAAVCGTIASFGFIANVSYGAWQEWWVATLLAAAALCAVRVTTR